MAAILLALASVVVAAEDKVVCTTISYHTITDLENSDIKEPFKPQGPKQQICEEGEVCVAEREVGKFSVMMNQFCGPKQEYCSAMSGRCDCLDQAAHQDTRSFRICHSNATWVPTYVDFEDECPLACLCWDSRDQQEHECKMPVEVCAAEMQSDGEIVQFCDNAKEKCDNTVGCVCPDPSSETPTKRICEFHMGKLSAQDFEKCCVKEESKSDIEQSETVDAKNSETGDASTSQQLCPTDAVVLLAFATKAVVTMEF